jgi:NAD(P)H-hydrate epimerase
VTGPARETLRGAQSRWFSREAVRAVDREAVETYGLPGIALMENAAAGLLAVALDMLGRRDGAVLLLCGPGNNGGDGFALARRLHNAGVATKTLLFRSPDAYTGDAATNLRVLEAMNLDRAVVEGDDPGAALAGLTPALIVDALLGTGLTSAPRGAIGEACAWLASAPAPVLAVDIPSGLDCDSGAPFDAARCARAAVTATMAGLKLGFRNEASRAWTGRVEVVDIGAPVACLDGLATITE